MPRSLRVPFRFPFALTCPGRAEKKPQLEVRTSPGMAELVYQPRFMISKLGETECDRLVTHLAVGGQRKSDHGDEKGGDGV